MLPLAQAPAFLTKVAAQSSSGNARRRENFRLLHGMSACRML